MAATEDRRKMFPERGSFVKKGTTIMEAEPFVAVLSTKLRKERCDNCFKKCEISRCSGCQYVYYCNKVCQRKAWPLHKEECLNIRRVFPREIPGMVRMIARTIEKLRNGGDKERGYYSPTDYRTFGDLMSHYDNIKTNAEEIEHFTAVYGVLMPYLGEKKLPPTRELLEIFGRIRINSFHVLDEDLKSIGVGVYLGPSIIDHSCKANTSTLFDGTTLILRAVQDISSFDVSKVFVSYIDALSSVDVRRAELLTSYYFLCNCERCTNPEPAMNAAACPNANCSNPCDPKEPKCPKCNAAFPPNFQDRFQLVESRTQRQITKINKTEEMDDNDKWKICKSCLSEQQGVLHPLNVLHGCTLEMAMSVAYKFEFWQEVELYARKLTQIYEYYYGDTHPFTAEVYFTLVHALGNDPRRKRFQDTAKKAWRLLAITMGETHWKTQQMKDIVRFT